MGRVEKSKIERVVRDQVRQRLKGDPKEAEFRSKYDWKPPKCSEKAWQALPTASVTTPDLACPLLLVVLPLAGTPLTGSPSSTPGTPAPFCPRAL